MQSFRKWRQHSGTHTPLSGGVFRISSPGGVSSPAGSGSLFFLYNSHFHCHTPRQRNSSPVRYPQAGTGTPGAELLSGSPIGSGSGERLFSIEQTQERTSSNKENILFDKEMSPFIYCFLLEEQKACDLSFLKSSCERSELDFRKVNHYINIKFYITNVVWIFWSLLVDKYFIIFNILWLI